MNNKNKKAIADSRFLVCTINLTFSLNKVKQTILFILFSIILLSVNSYAQANIEVIYLKNGSIIKGIILEQIIGDKVKIETTGGSIYVFKEDEIDKIVTEPSDMGKVYFDVIHIKSGGVITGAIIEQNIGKNLKLQTNDGSIFAYNNTDIEKITKEIVYTQSTTSIQNDTVKIETTVKEMFTKFYININAGYGLSYGPDLLLIKKDDSITPNLIEGVYGTYVKGLNLGGGAGFTLIENLIIELGITYSTKSSYEGNWMLQDGPFSKTDGSILTISPGIIIQPNLFTKIKPYIRAGVLIGFPSFSLQTSDTKFVNDLIEAAENFNGLYPDGNSDLVDKIIRIGEQIQNSNIELESIELNSSGNVAFGISAGLGVLYAISDNISISSELFFTNISWTPSKSKMIINTSGSLINVPLEINFEHSEGSDNPIDINQPIPYGSYGLKLGVQYEF